MQELPKRKANRLADYDYSSNGAYFITICTLDMKCILSDIVGADDLGSPYKIHLTKYGVIAEQNIVRMNGIYNDITVTDYVIMPNHIHMLLTVCKSNAIDSGAPRSSPPTNTLSKFVTAFKKFTEKEIGKRIWQRSYHDHIIRNDEDLCLHIQYIEENPKKWLMGKDKYYI
ncbi:MAG: transposase [Eubacterium sp.]|nr:transposase [Eubacterium sp.]